MFWAMEPPAQVPMSGSWKTRPMKRARRCSGQRVTSVPSTAMLPESRAWVPARQDRKVDLPAPLEPMMVMKSPCSMSMDRSRMLCTSFTLPRWKYLFSPVARIIVRTSF
ncbi:hypothetical protein DSECCO2_568590 [anaerobic digester metagenome]